MSYQQWQSCCSRSACIHDLAQLPWRVYTHGHIMGARQRLAASPRGTNIDRNFVLTSR
jgi:hypothetical protein